MLEVIDEALIVGTQQEAEILAQIARAPRESNRFVNAVFELRILRSPRSSPGPPSPDPVAESRASAIARVLRAPPPA